MPHAVVTLLMFGAILSVALPDQCQALDEPPMVITAKNPAPDKLPTLGVYVAKPWKDYPPELRVSVTFPNLPGFTCDCWCYEAEMDCVGVQALDGGVLELRHRDRKDPRIVYVTTITPREGAVDFVAHPQLASGATGPLPDSLQTLHMCWQLKGAPDFASAPDPYPEFVKRCFIFTEKGRTFLDKTNRKLIPSRPATDKENNPPWVQMYVGTWQEPPAKTTPESRADYSDDRYTTTVIGAVSRDGKYLAALASDSANVMCQAWHDCMRNSATWRSHDAPPEKRTWRVTLYAMENDSAALIKRAREDFPQLHPAPVTADAPAN